MIKARQGKEIVVRVLNNIGVVAQLAKVLSEKGVNILAFTSWTEGDQGIIHLVTDDNLRAGDALREKNYNPKERDVVCVDAHHKPGMLRHVTEQLASEDIDIHHLYASAPQSADGCLIVLACANNDRAVVLLNE